METRTSETLSSQKVSEVRVSLPENSIKICNNEYVGIWHTVDVRKKIRVMKKKLRISKFLFHYRTSLPRSHVKKSLVMVMEFRPPKAPDYWIRYLLSVCFDVVLGVSSHVKTTQVLGRLLHHILGALTTSRCNSSFGRFSSLRHVPACSCRGCCLQNSTVLQ